MRFLLDACVASRTLQEALTVLGHDVRATRGEHARASGEALLALAYKERRVLITEDKDFGELVYVRRLPHPGIVRLVDLRVAEQVEGREDRQEKADAVWPRYHQLDIVRRLLDDAAAHGAGRRYLIQHSAGSGKSNSIAWLAHQLIGLAKDEAPIFDSVIVVSDRRILERQIRDAIKHYAQVRATVGHAERSVNLLKFIESGKTSTDGGSNCSEAGRPVNTRTAAGLPQEAGATPGRRSSPCSPSSNSV